MPSLLARLLRYRPGALASNTVLATSLQLVRVGCQALSVILLARALGPHDYGAMVGYAGLAMITGTLSWLGGSYLMLEAVADSPDRFGQAWSATRHSVLWLSALLLLTYLLVAPMLLHLPLAPPLLLALGLSEILCYPLVYASGFAFQARERQGWANGVPAVMAVARLLAATLFALAGNGSLASYAWLHLGASVLGALLALAAVEHLLAPGRKRGRFSRAELRHGAGFLLGGVSLNAYGETDKIMAVRVLGAGPAGAYAIAYRVVSMLAIPATSLSQVAQVRMVQHARAGELASLRRLIMRLALAMQAYALLAAGAIWLAAPLLTPLLGKSFAAAVDVTRLLAFLLPLASLRILAVTVMTCLGRPALRAVLEGIAAGLMIMAISLLAPRFGLYGVAGSVFGVEALLFAALAGTALHLLKEARPIQNNGR